MHWKPIVLFTVPALMVLVAGLTTAQERSAPDRKHQSDRRAVDQLVKVMIEAFDRRDAGAIAAHWTEEGEFIRKDAPPIRGRADIQKGYAEFFQALKGKPKLEVQFELVRFPAPDMAISEAALRVKNEVGELVASGRQEIVLVRQDDQWKMALVREWDRDGGLDASLRDLQWLIGTWRAVTRDREVTMTYAWDENQAFLRGAFIVKAAGKVTESGTQRIGKDNARGMIRSWDFQSDGGFASGVWTRQGKNWSVEVQGVRADGKELTATTIFVPVDSHTITWQAVNQTLDGAPVADTPPIKVMKQKTAN